MSNMSSEFILHVKDEYDYRLLSYEKRKLIIQVVLYVMCNVKKVCTAFTIYYVDLINLNSVMTTHSHFKNKRKVRPKEKNAVIMNLEKFLDNERSILDRKTEMRKRTTILF